MYSAPPHPSTTRAVATYANASREAHDPLVAHVAKPGPWWLVVADMGKKQ